MLNSSDKQACKELVDWWNTGILKQDGVLANRADEHPHAPGDRRMAERDLIARVVKTVSACEDVDGDKSAYVAAIEFALEAEEGIEFLRCWNQGDFDVIRKEWPEAPEAVYIGDDPLYKSAQ